MTDPQTIKVTIRLANQKFALYLFLYRNGSGQKKRQRIRPTAGKTDAMDYDTT